MTRTEPATSASIPRGGPIPPLVPPLPLPPPPSPLRSETMWPLKRIVKDEFYSLAPFRVHRRWWWFPFWVEVKCFVHLEQANEFFDELEKLKKPPRPDVVVIREG